MAYEIGYRRPPKTAQFKVGKSGNPKGRPKGAKNLLTVLEKELGQKIVVSENGKKKTISRLEAMVKRLVAGALQGEQRALLTLVDVLRRTGKLEALPVESLLPDDYETVLDTYLNSRQNRGDSSPTTKE